MAHHAIPVLSREDYLVRVRAAIVAAAALRADQVDERLEDVARHLGTPKDEARLRQGLDAFQIDPEAGYAGLLRLYDLGQVRSVLEQGGFNVLNWHYDRRARVLLVNLRRGVHESLAASLYFAYRDGAGARPLDRETAAEHFLREGMGWFKSTASLGRVLRGADAVLDAQERMAFRGVDFHADDE